MYKSAPGLLAQSVFSSSGDANSTSAVSVTFPSLRSGSGSGDLSVLMANWASSPYTSSNLAVKSSVIDVRVVTGASAGSRLLTNSVSSFSEPVQIWHTLR